MKRVVAFFDVFDEIPDSATYLFSRRVEVRAENNETKPVEVNANNPDTSACSETNVYVHYYEVNGFDFDQLMSSDFYRKKSVDKMKEFLHKNKISIK